MLQGSATAVRNSSSYGPPTITGQNAARLVEIQRVDQDANRFLQQAQVNVVTPPAVFRAFLEKNHPEFPLAAEANNRDNILVVRGQWDDSTKPLESFHLHFDTVKTKDLKDVSFDKCKVLIVDCAGEVPKGTLQKIRDFVGWGGYLITTDWSLHNLLELAFPGFVQWNGDNTDGVITDAFLVDANSTLVQGASGRRFPWKLDKMSECVRILNPGRVHIIARSSRLAQQDPQFRVLQDPILAGVLAFEFTFGRGKILHLVGHFDNCSQSFKPFMLPDPAPGAGISLRQVLAANFIMEALNNKKTMPPVQTTDASTK